MRIMDDISEGRALFINRGKKTSKINDMIYTLYEGNMLTEPYVGEHVYFIVPDYIRPADQLCKIVVTKVNVVVKEYPPQVFDGQLHNVVRPNLRDFML